MNPPEWSWFWGFWSIALFQGRVGLKKAAHCGIAGSPAPWSCRKARCDPLAWLPLVGFRSCGRSVAARPRPDIVTAVHDPVGDPGQIDLDIFRSDVDDLEAQSLDGEALAPPEVCLGQMQNFSAGSDG